MAQTKDTARCERPSPLGRIDFMNLKLESPKIASALPVVPLKIWHVYSRRFPIRYIPEIFGWSRRHTIWPVEYSMMLDLLESLGEFRRMTKVSIWTFSKVNYRRAKAGLRRRGTSSQ